MALTFLLESFFGSAGRSVARATTQQAARAAIGALSSVEAAQIVVEKIAADETVFEAAAEAVTTEIAGRDIVEGNDARLPQIIANTHDWLLAAVDAGGKVMFGVRPNGYFEDFRDVITNDDPRLVTEVLDWEPMPWAVVFTTEDDRILGGWLKDGTFVDYMGEPTQAVTSTWPAVAYGDSTTYGADLVTPLTERWTTLLSAEIGETVQNFGSSGARAEEITARQGGISFTASVTGNQIPASGAVNLTNLELDPVRAGDVTNYLVEIEGVQGTLARSGADSTFTRTNAGSAVDVPAVVDVYSISGAAHRNAILFLGMGINNEGLIEDGDQTVDQICAWYTAATTSLTPTRPRFVVWGMLDRGPTEAVGTVNGDIIAEVETFLAKTYGSDFVNVRKYLASQRALDEAGLDATSDDLAAITAGTVPPSLRVGSGSVHLNAAGHLVMANLFARHLARKGWI